MKTLSYWAAQKLYSGTKNIVGQKKFIEKTGKEIKLSVGPCSLTSSNRKSSMIASDISMQAERLGDFFKSLGKKGPKLSKRCQKTY